MVDLQKLHKKYSNKGLVILGYNSSDKRSIALDLLKKQSLSFPCVLDSSMQAQMLAMRDYGASAVPTTYVIGRDGKVVDAWVGSKQGIPRSVKLLKQLGVK